MPALSPAEKFERQFLACYKRQRRERKRLAPERDRETLRQLIRELQAQGFSAAELKPLRDTIRALT